MSIVYHFKRCWNGWQNICVSRDKSIPSATTPIGRVTPIARETSVVAIALLNILNTGQCCRGLYLASGRLGVTIVWIAQENRFFCKMTKSQNAGKAYTQVCSCGWFYRAMQVEVVYVII